MKRKSTLIVLLGLVLLGTLLTGCNQASDTSTPAATNAAPAAPSTNK